jgi:putative phage-type endonuclease
MADLAVVDRTAEVTHFGDACEWVDGITSDNREAWLNVRRDYLTASDMAAVLGQDARKTPFQVWVEKVAEKATNVEADFRSPMFWGTALEWPIAQIAAKQFGWGLHRGGALLRSRRHPRLAATLDAEVFADGAWLAYEGKTTSFFLRRDWDEENQEPPKRVLIQAQHQLLVTAAPADVVFCLIGGNTPCKVIVEPNERFHQYMVEKAEWFWELVKRGVPPPVTAADGEAIGKFFPADNDGSVVRLPIEAREWTERILKLDADAKRAAAEAEELRNRIRMCIGSGTFGVLDEPVEDRRYWSWKEQQRASYVVKATTMRPLSRIKHGPPVDHIWDQLPIGRVKSLEEVLADSVQAAEAGGNGAPPPADDLDGWLESAEPSNPEQSDAAVRTSDAPFGEPPRVFGGTAIKRKRTRAKR